MRFERIRLIATRTGRRLKDRACIGTGVGSGISNETTFAFAREGARVAVADLNKGTAQSAADETCSSGGSTIAVGMEVTNEGQVERAVSDVVAPYGGADVLVSNAGIQIVHRNESFPFDNWKKKIAIHLDGAFLTTPACLPHMQPSGRDDCIIDVGSVHSKEASALKAAYVTAKHGLIGLCKTVAKTMEGTGSTLSSSVLGSGANPAGATGVSTRVSQTGIAPEDSRGRPALLRQPTRPSMSKLLTVLATLKAVLIVAVVTFATGDSLLVILISLLFNLAQLAAKRVDQTVPRDTVLFLSNVNQAADLRAAASSNAGNQSSNM